MISKKCCFVDYSKAVETSVSSTLSEFCFRCHCCAESQFFHKGFWHLWSECHCLDNRCLQHNQCLKFHTIIDEMMK